MRALYVTSKEDQKDDRVIDTESVDIDVARLRDIASQAPIIKFVNDLLTRAVEFDASDLHFEPLRDRLSVRFRSDGTLQEETIDSYPALPVISRIKIMSGMDIAEHRRPQDGRMTVPIRGEEVDIRVSTASSLHGETVVLRLLRHDPALLDLNKLRFPTAVLAAWRQCLQLADGVLLVTGPTGSGKTTTIAASLASIADGQKNIVTIEDPVEYEIAGLNQMQVHQQIGLDFPTLLRSTLRQDPDVLMVGEIRDSETAITAIQAATTGHLVVSTLHTNSAVGSIARLQDLGVSAYMLQATVRAVLAQRLVRRLCEFCAQPCLGGHSGELVAVGCNACRNTGFKGRISVVELLLPTETFWLSVSKKESEQAIEAVAVDSGMMTLAQNGLTLVSQGFTTKQELIRSGILRQLAFPQSKKVAAYFPSAK
jgi:general secretion pathway protein E